MRISDWSSDVCSSDLLSPTSLRRRGVDGRPPLPRSRPLATRQARPGRAEPPSRPPTTTERWACATPGRAALLRLDRKSVVEGNSGEVRVDLGGRRSIKKKTKTLHELRVNTHR